MENFGWPCYEGQGRQSGYDGANLNVCENLYGQAGAVTGPHFTYNHGSQVVAGETCPTGSSSVSGIDFYEGGPYPASYDGALFFADYSRDCIWVMKADASGIPAPGLLESFVAPAANPVDVQISPAGELFYADFDGGTIRRIQFASANQPPVAVASANPTSGAAPLTVNFDGSGSSDPDGDPITYAWDLDGDGLFDDSTAAQPTFTYTQSGSFTARLRVTDSPGASSVSGPIVITVGNTPPTATINAPSGSLTWRVGDVIAFSGSGTDPQDGNLPASALSWSLILNHCPSTCHSHPLQDFVGVASGSFTAPDHEYPSSLELVLTVTDSGGLTSTASVTLQPQTVNLTFTTSPSGLQLVAQRRQRCDALHAHGHRGVDQHDLGALAADPEREQLRLRLLVGRRAPRRTSSPRAATTTYAATYLAPPAQHDSACHHRADHGREDHQDVNGELDGLDTDVIHLSVAALRRFRRRLRGCPGRQCQQVHAGDRRRGPHDARGRHGDKRRRLQLGHVLRDLRDQAARLTGSRLPHT